MAHQHLHILSLPGVTRDSVPRVEDLFDSQIMLGLETPKSENCETARFAGIPPEYTVGEKWEVVGLDCWNCLCSFDHSPVFIPTQIYTKREGEITMSVEGNFCSFNCAARGINDKYPASGYPFKHHQYHQNLIELYRMRHGYMVREIKPAPSFKELKRFMGEGGLSQDDLLRAIRKLDPVNHNTHRVGETTTVLDRHRKTGWELCASVPGPRTIVEQSAFADAAEEKGGFGTPAVAAKKAEDPGLNQCVVGSGFGLSKDQPLPDLDDLLGDLLGGLVADNALAGDCSKKESVDDLLGELVGEPAPDLPVAAPERAPELPIAAPELPIAAKKMPSGDDSEEDDLDALLDGLF
jgi:hypothetical protein